MRSAWAIGSRRRGQCAICPRQWRKRRLAAVCLPPTSAHGLTMQPEGTATVDVIIVSHQDGPAASTDCDEEIARLLEEEELAEAPERTGAASSSAPGAAGTSSGAGAGSAAAGAEPGAPAPSAPPLPGGPASAWQQELREPPPPGAEAGGKAPADDEQLARSLHDQELRGLSQEQQGEAWPARCDVNRSASCCVARPQATASPSRPPGLMRPCACLPPAWLVTCRRPADQAAGASDRLAACAHAVGQAAAEHVARQGALPPAAVLACIV